MRLPKFKLYRTAVQNLTAARNLIRNHWAKNALAKDCNGKQCPVKSERAEAFCALGAVKRINGPGEKAAIKILRLAAKEELRARKKKFFSFNNALIFTVNDSIGKKAVLSMFRRAIAIAKKK
jgi:hypothetical protein